MRICDEYRLHPKDDYRHRTHKKTTIMRIAIHFRRFAPFHLARFRAVAESHEVLALQGCRRDEVYQWEVVSTNAQSFKTWTLFDDMDIVRASGKAIQEKVTHALDQWRPDAIAVNGYTERGSLACLEWGLKHRVPVITMSDSNWQDAKRHRLKEALKSQIVGLFSGGLAAGQDSRDYLCRLGLTPETVALGLNVVDNQYFQDAAERLSPNISTIRSQRDLPERFLLFIGRFVPKKNLHRLLEAYASYRNNVSAACDLVIAGDGHLSESLKKTAASLGLAQHVHWPGFVTYEALPEYYACAEAFILPSLAEQWGLVVNEAMASGLPVLVSNACGCAKDLVDHGRNGLIFAPESTEAIAEAMLALPRDPDELKRMGDASRKIIAEWGPARFAEGLLAVLEKTTGPVRRPLLARRFLLHMKARMTIKAEVDSDI